MLSELHGALQIHQNYGMKAPQLSLFGETVVINAYRTYTFEYDDPAVRQQAEKHKD